MVINNNIHYHIFVSVKFRINLKIKLCCMHICISKVVSCCSKVAC